MLLADLDQVDVAFISRATAERWSESGTLDFKRDLPGSSEQDKSELLKDVCAFANADGGDLVYGIDESGGVAINLTPITAVGPDAAQRRVLQVIDAGIEPRISGLRTHVVPLNGGYVLIIRVPASFQGPHCVRQSSGRRFVMRNGTTTSELTMDQLRSAFDRSATLADKAKRVVDEDLARLGAHQPLKAMSKKPKRVVHFVPLSGLAGKHAADLQSVRSNYAPFADADWGGANCAYNLDGLVVCPAPHEGLHDGYSLVCRNGVMSAVTSTGDEWRPSANAQVQHLILYPAIFFRHYTATFLQAAKSMGYAGPAVLSFALMHVRGYALPLPRDWRGRTTAAADRDHLTLPLSWIDDIGTAELDQVVRPLLDTLWQAFGFDRCWDYDNATGAFTPLK